MTEQIHIVCLDAPSPPDYGGAIDMHYKIQAFAETGKKIVLHYFDYNPKRNCEGLENICSEIHQYERKSIFRALPLSQPFIVQSRVNQNLIKRLNQDSHPILLEGLHCSGIIPFIHEPKRIVLRMHNEEASYYDHLALHENSFLKKKYFLQESKLIKQYQTRLNKTIRLACLSESDINIFRNDYGFEKAAFIPCFIPWQQLSIEDGKGDYCLYHGNMSVSENEEAALWLVQHVFRKTEIPFIIAGKGISNNVRKHAGAYKNITLIDQPSINDIDDLVRKAHINVLPSMNNTGVKLKLLNALLNGRHCITNYNGVKGSKIASGLMIDNEPEMWLNLITDLMKQELSHQQIETRKEVLLLYNNWQNAQKLSALWSHCQ